MRDWNNAGYHFSETRVEIRCHSLLVINHPPQGKFITIIMLEKISTVYFGTRNYLAAYKINLTLRFTCLFVEEFIVQWSELYLWWRRPNESCIISKMEIGYSVWQQNRNQNPMHSLKKKRKKQQDHLSEVLTLNK